MSHLKYLTVFLLIFSTSCWDYIKHGEDWTDNCTKVYQQAPAQFYKENITDADKDRFFYYSPNLQAEGTLQLINDNNNLFFDLSKTPKQAGKLLYNLVDVWMKKNEPDRYVRDHRICHGFNVKIPGEHIIDNKVPDMELQVDCTFFDKISGTNVGLYIAIPCEIDNENESSFSKEVKNLLKDKKFKDLPINVKFNNLDILDSMAMFDGVFYYPAVENIPPCTMLAYWYVTKQTLKVSKESIDILNEFIDKTKAPTGNNRKGQVLREDNIYLYSK